MFNRLFQSIAAGLLVAVIGVALAVPVSAANLRNTILEDSIYEDVGDATYGPQDTDQKDLVDVVVSIINFVLSLIGIIFLILVIYAGFLWMTAGGNDDQVGKAKKLIINSIIGIVIIVAAYAFTNFILEAVLDAFNG